VLSRGREFATDVGMPCDGVTMSVHFVLFELKPSRVGTRCAAASMPSELTRKEST